MSGIIGGVGSRSGVIGNTESRITFDADGWYNTFTGNIDHTGGAGVIPFADTTLGSNITETAGAGHGRVTIGTTGLYMIYVNLANNAAQDVACHIYLRLDQTQIQDRFYNESPGGTPYQVFSMLKFVEISAGQDIDVYGSGEWYGTTGTNNMSYWTGVRIGA